MMLDDGSLLAAIHEDVELSEHDPSWALMFQEERQRLLSAFPGIFLDLQHIGGTAVAALPAKPVIDLLAGVQSMEVARSLNEPLCRTGYTTSPEFNGALSDRQWFMRWAQGHRTHHLHVVVHAQDAWRERIAFRDVLRSNPGLAQRYADLKRALARTHRKDREAYTTAKAEFIHAVLRVA